METKRSSRDICGLKASLREARRVAVVGIGSELRGDDCAGLLVIHELRLASKRNPSSAARDKTSPQIRLFEGGTAPENLTGAILRWQPSHILLIDAAGLGLNPGTAQLIEPDQIAGLSFSTHALPLKMLTDYLVQSHPCQIILIGIQPECTDFGSVVSGEVKQAARRVAQEILDAVME